MFGKPETNGAEINTAVLCITYLAGVVGQFRTCPVGVMDSAPEFL